MNQELVNADLDQHQLEACQIKALDQGFELGEFLEIGTNNKCPFPFLVLSS
ncbi:6316_t:CDS:2 [Gigaspora margarita]|uniref:6316_t:CDS:1 n=1 Tax=Gigaspora margarita TaxID=4874 RepID=A0ABN7UEE7_GIGMA|nr:6316_t:CDS:2 [Gigaspora margarita]